MPKNGKCFNFVAYSGLIQNSAKASEKGLSSYPVVIHLSVAMSEAIPSLCLTNNKESKAFVCLTNSTILADSAKCHDLTIVCHVFTLAENMKS